MKSFFYLSVFLLMFFTFTGCDNEETTGPQSSIFGIIEGNVIDVIDNTNIAGASIKTEPQTSSITSDNLGKYKITDVNPGQYSIIIEKTGYYKNRLNVYVYRGKTSTLPVPLNKVIVNNKYPESPSLLSPGVGQHIKPHSFIFKWSCTDLDEDQLTYDFYLGRAANLLNMVTSNSKVNFIGNIILDYSTTYYWKVVAKDEHGAMAESETGFFVTTPN